MRLNPETVPPGGVEPTGGCHYATLLTLHRVVEPGQGLPTHPQSPRILGPKDPYGAGRRGDSTLPGPLPASSSELSPKRKGPRGRNCEAPPLGLSTSSAFTSLEAESLEKPTIPPLGSPFFLPFLFLSFLSSSFLFSFLVIKIARKLPFQKKRKKVHFNSPGTGWASHCSRLPRQKSVRLCTSSFSLLLPWPQS